MINIQNVRLRHKHGIIQKIITICDIYSIQNVNICNIFRAILSNMTQKTYLHKYGIA